MVSPIDSDTLFESGIVEVSTEVEPMFSSVDSQGIRLEAILKGLFHLPRTILGIAQPTKEVKRAFTPTLKGEVFPPAAL